MYPYYLIRVFLITIILTPLLLSKYRRSRGKRTNNDKFNHTVTAGDPSTGSSGLFDAGIMTNIGVFPSYL